MCACACVCACVRVCVCSGSLSPVAEGALFLWVFERVRIDGRLKIRLKSAPLHSDSH